ncbi:hypothetical protein [Micromonospora chokoriensis]|uniref:Uncharacterized protein n=1 Tax=Micromonospora chokoriensis TaxID=356851 RepID=A0A1C4ZDF0_9ACTN|nr:hypothetical protein [Micromonospora chokoriensis]SCF30979.1 hypothetical protein GA0070612_6251 [Micromonospora chokoriensis]
MSLGDVKAALRAAIEAARQGQEVFDQASAEAKTATAAAEAILNDSRDEDVRAVYQALAAASAEVEPTRRRFVNAAEHATRYLKQLG